MFWDSWFRQLSKGVCGYWNASKYVQADFAHGCFCPLNISHSFTYTLMRFVQKHTHTHTPALRKHWFPLISHMLTVQSSASVSGAGRSSHTDPLTLLWHWASWKISSLNDRYDSLKLNFNVAYFPEKLNIQQEIMWCGSWLIIYATVRLYDGIKHVTIEKCQTVQNLLHC